MANIELLGNTYNDVPAVELPKSGGGTVMFYENPGSKIKLIWTNPTPSSNFQDTTINFDDTYDAYVITVTAGTGYGVLTTIMLPSGVSANICAPYYDARACYRNVSSTTSKITFTIRSGAEYCIPTYIYGIKL